MTAKKVMMAASAQPWGQKRTTLTQELIRRLLNCSKRLSCARKRKHLDHYMQLLKNSGYSEMFRAEILKSGLKGYNLILQAERESIRPVYRPKEQIRRTKSAAEETESATESLVSAAWGLEDQQMWQNTSTVHATMENRRKTCTAGRRSMSPSSTAKVRRSGPSQPFTSIWSTRTEGSQMTRIFQIILKSQFWKPTKNLSQGWWRKERISRVTKVNCWTQRTNGIRPSWWGQQREWSKEEQMYFNKEEEEAEVDPREAG